MRADHNGATAYRMERRALELGDIPIALQWNLWSASAEQPFGLGARVGIELPTGDADRGFGNGGVDVALGLVGEWRSARVGVTGHVQHTFAQTPDLAAAAGLSVRDVSIRRARGRDPSRPTWALLAQTEIETSALADLEVGEAADPQWLAVDRLPGPPRGRFWLDIALAEDLTTDVPADFTAWVALRYQRGRRSYG